MTDNQAQDIVNDPSNQIDDGRPDSDIKEATRLPKSTIGSRQLLETLPKGHFRSYANSKKARVLLVSGNLTTGEAATFNLPIKCWCNSRSDVCLVLLTAQVRDSTILFKTGWEHFYPLRTRAPWLDIVQSLAKHYDFDEELSLSPREAILEVQTLPHVLKTTGPKNIAPHQPEDKIGVAILTELSKGKTLDDTFLSWWSQGRCYDAHYLLVNRKLYEYGEMLFKKI